MPSQWFSDAELEEMSSPVIKRIIRAVIRGRDELAVELCDILKEERIILHDFFADACTALYTWIGRNLGEEKLEDMFVYSFEQSALRQIYNLLDIEIERGLEAYVLARAGWVAHSCSGAGEHGGAFSLAEDDEKFTFIMDPCGSGGRLWRKGRYEPPFEFGLTKKAYPWSYNRENFPYYCVHCSFLNELLPYKHLGYINWPVDPPVEAMDVCKWHLYKDKHAVPQEYYERFGLRKQDQPRRDAPQGGRWYSEDQLKEIAKPTFERIREKLQKGNRKEALRICFLMGGEFFFLHNLYVNMLVTTLDFIAKKAGEERLGEVLSYVYEKCVKHQIVSLIDGLTKKDALRFIIHNFFLADLSGGAGMPPAKFSVQEDKYGITIILNPCASGGKLIRHKAYEPLSTYNKMREEIENRLLRLVSKLALPRSILEVVMPFAFEYFAETRKPKDVGLTQKAYEWSDGRQQLPYYCAMCTSFLKEAEADWLEVVPPRGIREPCVWRAKK